MVSSRGTSSAACDQYSQGWGHCACLVDVRPGRGVDGSRCLRQQQTYRASVAGPCITTWQFAQRVIVI
ncbi:hypothetical protein SK128_010658 [Halocaridina rubra]|uniref:Uncharacterized protein n=1 Tax=Halocaridina rubra TaxID=373956 RepID=A0AAN8X617_HALRR